VIPISDTAPRASPPTIVLLLIGLNLVVFLWMRDLPHHELNRVILNYALVPLRYADPEAAYAFGLDPNNWWPLLTNTFMHGGWLHLILNMWTLWIFGPAMEARCGRVGFLTLYLVGAVVASFTHLVANWGSLTPALGASGAIAAVIAAYAVIYPRERILLLVPILIFPLFIPVSALLFGFGWFALQLLQGTSGIFAPDMAGGIAWWAHIGGFGFGAVFAIFVRERQIGRSVTARSWAMPARGRMLRPRGPWDI
jgi:rhomboid family protein